MDGFFGLRVNFRYIAGASSPRNGHRIPVSSTQLDHGISVANHTKHEFSGDGLRRAGLDVSPFHWWIVPVLWQICRRERSCVAHELWPLPHAAEPSVSVFLEYFALDPHCRPPRLCN